jgi:glucosamine-6-phosphate deaminase
MFESQPHLRQLPDNRHERLPVFTWPRPEEAACAVAAEIAGVIRQCAAAGRPAVLGLATGSTPLGVYRELIRLHQEQGLSFRDVITFNLDEYYGLPPSDPRSYRHFMNERLFRHLDIPLDRTYVPDGLVPRHAVAAHCREFEERIAAVGGIDFQLLGIGRSGHIGFNEPGSGRGSRTRLVTLDRRTRADAAGDFGGEHLVPRHAITMGVETILSARSIALLAFGEHKAAIVRAAIEGPVTADLPASYLQGHSHVAAVLDASAASALTRTQTPWLVADPTELGLTWDDALIRRAVCWLAGRRGKSILKLTDNDYAEEGLEDLLRTAGSAYDLNLAVFRRLQATITGWPAGRPVPPSTAPEPRCVVVFAPHPDDEVISMGGTLARLAAQGHEVHVAYQTSGAAAVPDKVLARHLDFTLAERPDPALAALRAELGRHGPGFEPPAVLARKARVRRLEATAGAAVCGVPAARLHFLDLPFYGSGGRHKLPVTAADLAAVRELLLRLRPSQIYAAGDLADPHGTHRLCLELLAAVLRELPAAARPAEAWLYRGAWGEWAIPEVDLAVPLSPDELALKRRAVLEHESQRGMVLFRGGDEREFWERAEARNRAAAAAYRALGWADYEALETFRAWHPAAG